MGMLSIIGKSEREVSYNAIELSVKFHICRDTTAEALQSLMEQSEKFLTLVTAAGIDMQHIYVGDNSVHQSSSYERTKVYANREITMHLYFDMAFVNHLTAMIKEHNFEVILDCRYHLTNSAELHMELMKEALADSRKKAEAIAEITGQKIIGISSVEHTQRSYGKWGSSDVDCASSCCGAPQLSDHLQAPLTTEDETISVVWLTE